MPPHPEHLCNRPTAQVTIDQEGPCTNLGEAVSSRNGKPSLTFSRQGGSNHHNTLRSARASDQQPGGYHSQRCAVCGRQQAGVESLPHATGQSWEKDQCLRACFRGKLFTASKTDMVPLQCEREERANHTGNRKRTRNQQHPLGGRGVWWRHGCRN